MRYVNLFINRSAHLHLVEHNLQVVTFDKFLKKQDIQVNSFAVQRLPCLYLILLVLVLVPPRIQATLTLYRREPN